MKCISLYVLALGLLAGSARVPVPTAHAAGRSAPQAVLGATRQAWRHAMGRPSPWQKGDSMGWGTCPGTRMDQVVVTFADGRAEMVSGLYCSGHPSARARLALALRYAPPDARAHGTARGDLGRAPLYVSHQLARALPPALFTDCDGNPAPRGSFVVDVHDIDGTPQWQLTPGACDS